MGTTVVYRRGEEYINGPRAWMYARAIDVYLDRIRDSEWCFVRDSEGYLMACGLKRDPLQYKYRYRCSHGHTQENEKRGQAIAGKYVEILIEGFRSFIIHTHYKSCESFISRLITPKERETFRLLLKKESDSQD